MTEKISLRQKVFNYLDKNPTADRMKSIEAFSEYSANSVRTYFTQYYKILKENISQNISQQRSGPIKDNGSPDHPYVDDPDELLMSVAIRELNRPNPAYQWANILLNARKQKITIQGDEKQLQRLSITSLVSKLKEKLPSDVLEETRQASETTLSQ